MMDSFTIINEQKVIIKEMTGPMIVETQKREERWKRKEKQILRATMTTVHSHIIINNFLLVGIH